jgi:hypothetical protein
MTTVVAFPKADLDQVFDEVEDAQADVEAKRGALRAAQEKAEAAKGLTVAAQRALRDAQANLQLLELAKDEAESKNTEYASISAQLADVNAELKQARAQRAAVEQARGVLREIKSALQGWVSEAKQATAAFDNSAATVEKLPLTAAQKKNTVDPLRNEGTSLNTSLDQLGKPQAQRLDDAGQQLDKLAPSATRIARLESDAAGLERKRNMVKPKPGKAPGPAEIQTAEADKEAAKTAAEEAPEVERDRLAKLKLARENLAAAQDRLTASLVAQDAAERSWIEGIDFVGPGADGFVTAKAKLASTSLPADYSLEWTFDGVAATPDSEGNIHFNTKALATGSYAIAVHLHRDKATP